MKISFFTLGCKVNQYETQMMKEQFEKEGYTICENCADADIFVVNSCTVTMMADKKTRQAIHRFKRDNKDGVAVLVGCFPQAFFEKASQLEGVDIICGVKDKSQLTKKVDDFIKNHKQIISVSPHTKGEAFESLTVHGHDKKTRAFLKIEDGCERYCTYCIIPKARGYVRSKPITDVLKEVEELANQGYKEIVLVGVNLSMYGRDINSSLSEICKLCCDKLKDVRIRLGSTEPILVSADDFKILSGCKNLCPQFHMALQSGCDDTLKRMGRPYTTKMYADLVKAVRGYFPNAAITTDIMVGFPGETDEEFNKTVEFVKAIGFASAHIFPYSPRPSTEAAKMTPQIDEITKAKRAKLLAQICMQSRKDFLSLMVSTTQEVLFENITNEYGTMGHTPNYTPVYVKSDIAKRGEIIKIKITASKDEFCIGEPV